MKLIIFLLILIISSALTGCIGQDKDMEKAKQDSDKNMVTILEDNSSVEDIRTAIIETLEEERAANNS